MNKTHGCMAWTAAAMTAAAMPVFAESSQLAFWSFAGEAGAVVDTVSDGTGTYTGTAYVSNVYGQKPKFSDDGPGPVFAMVDGVRSSLCSNPQSLEFRYKERSTRQSGYVDVEGLADSLSGLASFTIEYFIKMDSSFNYYDSNIYSFTSKTALYVSSGSCAFKQIAPSSALNQNNGLAVGLGLQAYKNESAGVPGGSCSWKRNGSLAVISDNKWHHVAIVYSETNSTSRLGSLALYCDDTCVGSMTYCNDNGSGRKFRIGSGYKDITTDADKTATEPIHASISCLRVCGEALQVGEFMYVDDTSDISEMETAAFYDFKDGAPGDAVSVVSNSVDSALFQGTGSKTGEGAVVFSDERPAAKILASSSADDVLVENPQSVRFVGGRSGNGGKVALGSLATSLSRLDAYTVEFFFKMEAYDNWRTMAAWKFGDKVSVKVNMTGTAGSYPETPGTYNGCALEPLTNTTDQAVAKYSSEYTRNGALGDSWHHLAAVYTRSDNSLWLFIDKKLVGGSVSVTNQFTRTQYPLILGTSAFSFKENQEFFGGYVSCLRVTPRALTADAFMTTSDKAVPSNTVFALDFNSGVMGTQMVANNTSYAAIETYPYGIKPNIVYNLFQECTPWYQQSSKSDRSMVWGSTEMWKADKCLYFPAGSNVTGQANAEWYGAVLTIPALQSYTARKMMNPSSWTAEIYARLERTGLPTANTKQGLIFGKVGNSTDRAGNTGWPKYSWLLTYTQDSKLRVYWTERPSPDFTGWPENVYDTTYYKSATTEQAYMGDLKWHHLALSYDSDAKQFKLYVDKKLALAQSLMNSGEQNALHDGNYVYCFGRSPTTGGFEGWMDEFRFTSRVLQPEEFERFDPRGMIISFR